MDRAEDLAQRIDEIATVDTHTHLGSEWAQRPCSVEERVKAVVLGGYLRGYLVSTGAALSEDAYRELGPVEFLEEIAPHVEALKATGTYGATLEALRDLYGFEGNLGDGPAAKALVERIGAAYEAGEEKRWQEVFAKANVEVALKNVELPYFSEYLPSLPPERRRVETGLLRAVPRVDCFLFGPFRLKGSEMLEVSMPGMIEALDGTMRALNQQPEHFEDYLGLIEAAFDCYERCGAVGVKLTTGYLRELRFDEAPRREAEKVFSTRHAVKTLEEVRAFQDYVLRFVLEQCAAHDLPIQIHTGLQSGNDSNMPECNPIGLTGLFRERSFGDVRFVLLHGGYPYTGETGVLAKSFANVYLDCSWLTLLSPLVCARCLGEWLELVPWSKIMHGSDAHTAEEVYGVTKRGRKVLATVLGRMMEDAHLATGDAVRIASGILRENAQRVYCIKN